MIVSPALAVRVVGLKIKPPLPTSTVRTAAELMPHKMEKRRVVRRMVADCRRPIG